MTYLDCVFILVPLIIWLLFWVESEVGYLEHEDFEFAFFAILLAPLSLLCFILIITFLFMLFTIGWINEYR